MSINTLRAKLADIVSGTLTSEETRKKWELCASLAEDLWTAGGVSPSERAFISLVWCQSLSHLGRYNQAVEPGRTACVLAQEIGDYDVLGQALLEIAYIQGLIPGQEPHASESLTRFLANKDRYGPRLREKVPMALYNLAVTERAAHRHPEALEHFGQAWELTTRAEDAARRETYRQDYCFQALLLNDLALANKLLALGAEYLKLHPREKEAEIHVQLDRALYTLLSGDYPGAIALAMDAVCMGHHIDRPGHIARALLTWSRACESLGDLDSALSLGFWAHIEAQRSQRPELIAEVRRTVRGIRLQDYDTADRVVTGMLRPA